MKELLERLTLSPNRWLDFGPLLDFPVICQAMTVEKITVWQRQTENELDFIALQGKKMPRARAEGTLYELTDQQLFELDKQKNVELCCTRKRLPIYLPFNNPDGSYMTLYAWIYIGRQDFWVEKITQDQNPLQWKETENGFLLRKRQEEILSDGTEFTLLKQYSHPDPLFNFRTRFLPPEFNSNTMREPSQSIIKNVKKRNRAAIRELFFDRLKGRLPKITNEF